MLQGVGRDLTPICIMRLRGVRGLGWFGISAKHIGFMIGDVGVQDLRVRGFGLTGLPSSK